MYHTGSQKVVLWIKIALLPFQYFNNIYFNLNRCFFNHIYVVVDDRSSGNDGLSYDGGYSSNVFIIKICFNNICLIMNDWFCDCIGFIIVVRFGSSGFNNDVGFNS